MALNFTGQAPDKPFSGSTILPSSVAGRKQQLVQQTTTVNTSFTIGSNDIWTTVFYLQLWPENIPASAKTDFSYVTSDNSIAWPFMDMYVDTNNDSAYALGWGSSLSSGQQKIVCGVNALKNPLLYGPTISQAYVYSFHNFDSTSHVIYLNGLYKYEILGDQSI